MNRQQPGFGLQTAVRWPLLCNRGRFLAAQAQLTAPTPFSHCVSAVTALHRPFVLAVGLHSVSQALWLARIVVVQLPSRVWLCSPMDCSTPGFPVTISWSLPEFMSTESVMPSSHLILCLPLLLPPPASRSFPMSRLFASCDQSIGASASVLPMSIQGCFPLRLAGWPPCCPRDSRESSPAHSHPSTYLKSLCSSRLGASPGFSLNPDHTATVTSPFPDFIPDHVCIGGKAGVAWQRVPWEPPLAWWEGPVHGRHPWYLFLKEIKNHWSVSFN